MQYDPAALRHHPHHPSSPANRLAQHNSTIIGASLNEPHTNQYYEKTAVLLYVLCIIESVDSISRDGPDMP